MKLIDKIATIVIVIIVILLFLGLLSLYKNDSNLKTECEKAGGILIGTRDPSSVCIKSDAILLKESK